MRKPVTHLLKPGPLSDLQLRCGVKAPKVRKGDLIGTEDGIAHIDCAGCLRGLIVAMRLKEAGVIGRHEHDEPSAEALWLAGGDTGTSSMTIWSVMTGYPIERTPSVPWDPSDFGRCHRLLAKFPGWRARMGEVATKHPAWAGLVAAWDELTALYIEEFPTGRAPKLYARMKELTHA